MPSLRHPGGELVLSGPVFGGQHLIAAAAPYQEVVVSVAGVNTAVTRQRYPRTSRGVH